MPHTLQSLAEGVRRSLKADDGSDGIAECRTLLSEALRDPAFRAAIFGPERTARREVLYEDPELGFCICAHVYGEGAYGHPHDHGESWAIYGQAEGVTEMTDWRIVKPLDGDDPALVEPVRTYKLHPGDAQVYEVGAVHSPARAGPTKLVRIEGKNLDTVRRTPIKAAQGAAA